GNALDPGLDLRDLHPAHAGRREARVGGEKADGVVAPVVGESALLQVPLRHRMMDGQQFNRRDAQAAEMIERGRGGEGRVGAAELRGNLRMTGGEPLDVYLAD